MDSRINHLIDRKGCPASRDRVELWKIAAMLKQPLEREKMKQSHVVHEDEIEMNKSRIKQLEQELIQANQTIHEIVNSRSWKLIMMLQKIRLWLVPRGSIRERVVQGIFRFVRGVVQGFRKGMSALRVYSVREVCQLVLKRMANRPKVEKITNAARNSFKGVLRRLDIQYSADTIIAALSENLGKTQAGRIVGNFAAVENYISTTDNKTYPLLKTIDLPDALPNAGRRNILFITAEFPSPHHGGGNRVINFIEKLSVANDIYLCTSYYKPHHESLLPVIEKYCRSILKIPHIQFGGNQAEIRDWLHGVHMDIVHYEWPHSLENYSPDFGKTQIFTYMEAVSLRLLMDMQRLSPLSGEWLDKLKELAAALQLEVIQSAHLSVRIAVTTQDGEFFRKLNPSKRYAVLNHGLDFESFELPNGDPEPHTLVFVGNYLHYPNVDAIKYFFAEIWDQIQKEVSDVRMYIVGANPPEELRKLADARGVIVTGAVPDVRPYIQKASVCIAPLITGAGLRGKVIEYAALHRPFVATSIAAMDLVFKDGIDYYCADKPLEFSKRVISLLKDPQLAANMASSAYETAKKNYDTGRLTHQLLSLYDYVENLSNEN